MNKYKTFSELKEELGSNYDFVLYEMGISAVKKLEQLQQENEKLKSQLNDTTHCFDEEEHRQLKERIAYLERSIERKEETITELDQERVPYTNEYVDKVKKENEELKKQLEEYKRLGFKHLQDKNNELETQQQEFIKYLEDMLDDDNDIFSVIRVKDVLQKYKEIIGGNKDEK